MQCITPNANPLQPLMNYVTSSIMSFEQGFSIHEKFIFHLKEECESLPKNLPPLAMLHFKIKEFQGPLVTNNNN
jgi:hypothetical protein